VEKKDKPINRRKELPETVLSFRYFIKSRQMDRSWWLQSPKMALLHRVINTF